MCGCSFLGIVNFTEKSYKNLKRLYQSSGIIPYSGDEALAFLLDNNLTKDQYINIRLSAKKRGADIYPSYEKILVAKTKCYPKNMLTTESFSKIKLQNLLDHTVSRIVQIPFTESIDPKMVNYEMIYKWGCDGSSGQAQYKQKLFNSTTANDSNIFMFSIVPLQLRCNIENHDKKIILWENIRTSSTRYCRPIQFEYKKETAQVIRDEVNNIDEEIKNLNLTMINQRNINIGVQHTLLFTMVDGKVSTYIINKIFLMTFIINLFEIHYVTGLQFNS